jgi:hypothetical protein
MARRNTTTTTTEKAKTAEAWFAEMADTAQTRHRRLYAGCQGVKHLVTEESRKEPEECDDVATADYLADFGALVASLCDRKALLAEAKARKGASMTARRNSGGASAAAIAAAVNAAVAAVESRQAAVIAELMARLAAAEAPAAPPAKKGGRVSLK